MSNTDAVPRGGALPACQKCGSRDKEKGEFRAAGGFGSSFFNVSTRRFRYLSCKGCGYTEFFNASISGSQQFLDFIGG